MKKRFFLFGTALVIIIFFTFSQAPKSEALFGVGDVVHDPINYIVNGLHLAATHLGIISSGLPGTGAAVDTAVETSKIPCEVGDTALNLITSADNLGSVSAVLGSAPQLLKLQAKLTALTAVNSCYSGVLYAVEHGGSLAGVTGEQALTAMGFDKLGLEQQVSTNKIRIDNLVQVRDQVETQLWQAVAYKILSNVQQVVTTRLVNQIVQKYKISDYTKYADAVATQVYTASYIEKNYPNNVDKLMLRSVLGGDFANGTIMPIVQQQAQDSLGFTPSTLDVTSTDFYSKMAQAGSSKANPFFLQTVLQDQVSNVKAQSALAAQQEISQGQGFIPARNCNGVISQQNQVLAQKRQQLSKDLQTKQLALQNLRTQQIGGTKLVGTADLTIAAQDISQAGKALQDLSATPEAKVCADIANPAGAISNFTNSFLQSQLTSANGLKTDNTLGLAGNLLASTASNFLDNIILGGINSLTSSGSGNNSNNSPALLSGNGFVPAAIASANVISNVPGYQQFLDSSSSQASALFTVSASSTNGSYILSWNASAVSGADHIIIQGPNNHKYTSSSLTGSTSVTASSGNVYTLFVYDVSVPASELSKVSVTITSLTPGAVNIPAGDTISSVNKQVQDVDSTLQQNNTIPNDSTSTTAGGSGLATPPCIGQGHLDLTTSDGDLSFVTSGCDATNVSVGDTYTVSITGAAGKTPVSLLINRNGTVVSHNQVGTTDPNGYFATSGSFSQFGTGAISESWTVGDRALGSISFNVSAGTVKGDYAARPLSPIRGPEGIHPRGEE